MKGYEFGGEKPGPGFSREICAMQGDYGRGLTELEAGQEETFLRKKDFAGVNVPASCGQTVIPFLDGISPEAKRIGGVNTVVNREGRLWGYHTAYFGMKAMLRRLDLDLTGKKVLILGTDGIAAAARAVAEDLGAAAILHVSRRGSDKALTREEAEAFHRDAAVILNTAPRGTFPEEEISPLNLALFSKLEGVADAVSDPLRTDLVLDAGARGIPAAGGLYLSVMQTVKAAELVSGRTIPREQAEQLYASICGEKENIVLIGMPGSGKSTLGRILQKTGLTFWDTDEEIVKKCSCSIREYIHEKGEGAFRELETAVIREVSRGNGRIIATGGGAVLRQENVRCLKHNGRLFFLQAALERLEATEDRPLSDTREKLAKLYKERMDTYLAAADVTVPDPGDPEEAAAWILTKREELIRCDALC